MDTQLIVTVNALPCPFTLSKYTFVFHVYRFYSHPVSPVCTLAYQLFLCDHTLFTQEQTRRSAPRPTFLLSLLVTGKVERAKERDRERARERWREKERERTGQWDLSGGAM